MGESLKAGASFFLIFLRGPGTVVNIEKGLNLYEMMMHRNAV